MAELASGSTSDAEDLADSLPEEEQEEAAPDSSAPADADEVERTLPLDQVFSILKNQRRRRVLKYLRDAEGSVSLSDLAEEIAALENGKDVSQISSSERKRAYVGLYQCHLPKMDSMGVVSFNKPRGLIESGENVDVLYDYLETADDTPEKEWHLYSPKLSVAGAAALGTALVVDAMVGAPVVDVAVGLTIVAFLLYAVLGFESVRGETSDDAD